MSDRRIYKTAIDEVTTSQTEDAPLGSLRWEGGSLYKYVKLLNTTATVAGVAGDPANYAKSADDGAAEHIVVLDNTDADAQPIGAGLLTAAVAGVAGTAYYCWIQLTGVATVPTAVGSGVVGSDCMPSTTDKTLTVRTGVIHGCAVLLDATAANNRVLCRFPY